jgi:hypothetical protein
LHPDLLQSKLELAPGGGMQLSREFVGLMGLFLLFLLAAFATEDARCVARARRVIEQLYMPIPAATAEREIRDTRGAFTFAASHDAGESCLRPAEYGR